MEVGDQSEVQTAAAIHVLVFPFPAQGHLTSMLKLAELLTLAGRFRVTFLNSDYNHHRIRRFSGSYDRIARQPGFCFRSIPDGLPDDQPRSASRFMDLEESLRTRSAGLYRDLLITTRPPVTCVVVDGIMTFAIDVAEGLGIPAIAFRTSSSCSYWAYFCIPKLIQSGELPFPDETDLDVPVRGVPGMEDFLRRRDLPSFCRIARDVTDRSLRFVSTVTNNTNRARGLIFNTMEFLEAPILDRIRSQCPVTYTLGPLHSLLRSYCSRHSGDQDGTFTSISASMWEEDRSCMAWLDAQSPRSVVYVSFGSLTVIPPEEMVELWHGLVNSGRRFLWVVRPGLVGEGGEKEEEEDLPSPPAEVEAAARERGYLVRWAPQEEVLAHPAVGCFLTHSGWNSTLESMVAGLPMICWPFFVDQMINSRYVSEVWRVGVDMKDQCNREVVEMMVREVMEGETAEELRRSAGRAAELARRAVEEGGSSHRDLLKLIQHITSLSSEVAN